MILIVEDEVKLAGLLEDYFAQAHYATYAIHNGDEVMPWLEQNQPQVILLDLMLPGKDGLTLCREIRATSNVPIIMTTAKVEEIDRLLGLELGADDYICKPYSPREVVARVKAVLRRTAEHAGQGSSIDQPGGAKGIELDDNRLTLTVNQQSIEFTAIEYQLIKQLANSPGQIFSRTRLMETMYSDNRVVSDRTIDSHIKKIRKKLHDALLADPRAALGEHEWIESVYGVGYRFNRL